MMAVRFYGDSGAAGLTFTATAGEDIAQNDLLGRTSAGTVKVAKGYSPRNAQIVRSGIGGGNGIDGGGGIRTAYDSAMAVAYCSFYDVMIVVHNFSLNLVDSPSISLIGKNGYQNTLAPQKLTSGALDRVRSTALIWDDTLRAGVIFTCDNGGGGGTLRYWHFEVNSATSVTVSARTITSVGSGLDYVAADLIASGEGLIIQDDNGAGLKAAYVAFSNTAISTFSSTSAIAGSTASGQPVIKAEPGADRALVCYQDNTGSSKAAMLSKNGTSAPTWGSVITLNSATSNYRTFSIDYDTINSSWLVGSIYWPEAKLAARIMTNSGTTVTATGNWAVANNALAFGEPVAFADPTTGKNFVFSGFLGPNYIKVTPSSGAQTGNIEADFSAANTGFNTFASQYSEHKTGVYIGPWANRFYYLVGQETGSFAGVVIERAEGPNFYSFDPEEETFVGAASQTVGIATAAAANNGTVTVSAYVESDAYTGFSTGETLYIDVAGNIVANNTGSIIGVGKDATAVYILPNSTAFATAITE
jgi:hypothetical protein